jgi:hypothetical protein
MYKLYTVPFYITVHPVLSSAWVHDLTHSVMGSVPFYPSLSRFVLLYVWSSTVESYFCVNVRFSIYVRSLCVRSFYFQFWFFFFFSNFSRNRPHLKKTWMSEASKSQIFNAHSNLKLDAWTRIRGEGPLVNNKIEKNIIEYIFFTN